MNQFNMSRTTLNVIVTLACTFLAGCHTVKSDAPKTFVPKLPPPLPLATNAALRVSPFEQQFRIDTGETNSTLQAEFDRPLRIQGQSKDRLLLRPDLSAWPEALRKQARIWVGIGAASSFTTEVNVTLTFPQNGAAVTMPLNNMISIDGMTLLGCDFSTPDGDVAVEIQNEGIPRDVDYTLHAIAYVPWKPKP